MRSDNDVSGNEKVVSEDTQTLDNPENEVVENEETEATVLYEANDYTQFLCDISGLLILQCVILIGIGCIIAWTGAHHE